MTLAVHQSAGLAPFPLTGLSLPATDLELACHRVDPDVFFAESPAEVEHAKALCQGCPLQAECLAGALERREPWGVWGGQLFVQGEIVARKRPRGRPRKHPRPDEPAPVVAVGPSPFRKQRAA